MSDAKHDRRTEPIPGLFDSTIRLQHKMPQHSIPVLGSSPGGYFISSVINHDGRTGPRRNLLVSGEYYMNRDLEPEKFYQ